MKQKWTLPDGLAVYGGLALLLLLGVAALLFPSDFSVWERRRLQEAPANFSLTDWTLQTDLEAYLSDQVPFRRALVNTYACFETATGRAVQLDAWPQADSEGRLHFIEKPVSAAPDAVQKRIDALLSLTEGLPCRFLTPPTAGSLLRSSMWRPRSAVYDADAALYETVFQLESAVPVLAAFAAGPDADLYFRTDHHWNLDGAWQAYRCYCEAAGLAPAEESQFSWVTGSEAPRFFGTTYSRSGLPFADADALAYAEPKYPLTFRILDDDTEYDRLIFPEEANTYDGYALFLKGNHGLIEILNPSVPERTLFVCKDSFANCLLPFLSANYSRIVAADARYLTGTLNEALADAGHVDEVLFIYSLDSLATDTSILRKIRR
ncbi:MAG: hypothetical protein IK099_08095 [Clostridia bacterium]|nr:hypothetical protein [Clostridia bacterium]